MELYGQLQISPTTAKIMNNPLKRNSELLKKLREEEPLERKRARTSMMLASIIIKAIRFKKWSKIEFAAKMDKKPSVISKWLSGTHNFTSDTLSDIEEVLGVKVFNCEQGDNELTYRAAIAAGMAIHIFPPYKSEYSSLKDTAIIALVSSVSSSQIQIIGKSEVESN